MGKRIYLLEDDEDIRFIVEYILMEAGYSVDSFGTVREFNAQISISQPDLVLLDVMLPDGNGMDICRALKTNERTVNIPVLIMSAHAAEKSVLEEACADTFISKPFDLDNLLQLVKRTMAP